MSSQVTIGPLHNQDFQAPIATRPKLSLEGLTIMVNPGHGVKKQSGVDTGATGKLGKKNIYEVDLNAQVAEKLARKLKALGAKVIYVDNKEIHEIQDLENKIRPDLFISIHHDSNKSKNVSGETVYAWGKSLEAANAINDALKVDKKIPNNPMKPNWAKDLCVLKADPNIPAVLAEIGYVSNSKELKILTTPEYQDVAAQSITEGIKKFFKNKKKNPEVDEIEEFKLLQDHKFTDPLPLYQPRLLLNNRGKDI